MIQLRVPPKTGMDGIRCWFTWRQEIVTVDIVNDSAVRVTDDTCWVLRNETSRSAIEITGIIRG
jgi:hypothetical protein